MGRQLKLTPLLLVMTLALGAVAAHAITWSAPTYPFYASFAEHGAMYFTSTFTADVGNWTGGLLTFYNMSYAGSAEFTQIGFAAQNDTSFTLLEAIPTDHILIQANSVGAARNVTILTLGHHVLNVTNAEAWTYDNATDILELTAPLGIANINISFIAGSGTPTIFFIPQWFVDQGGAFFGVSNFFASILSVMGSFVAWFTSSVTYIGSLIYWIMTGITGWGLFVITWFGRAISFLTNFGTAMNSVWTQFSTASAPYAEVVALIFSADGLMLAFLIGFMSWFGSLPARAKRAGGDALGVLVGDLQKGLWIVEAVWSWSWTIFNFVYGVVMQFVSLLWGLIP